MDAESEDEAGMEDEEEALPEDVDLGSTTRHIVPYSPQSGVIVLGVWKAGLFTRTTRSAPQNQGGTGQGGKVSGFVSWRV